MLPSKAHPKWAALLQGHIEYKFNNAAASMQLFQLKCDLKRDASPAALSRAIEVMHGFFTKYQRMLQTDIDNIFN